MWQVSQLGLTVCVCVWHCTFTFRGDCKILQKGPFVGSAWLDNKVLTVLSTPVATGTVLRRQKDSSRVPVKCPENIIMYNKYMGGVDRGDQLRGYYCCHTKSRKFYKYLFYFLFDMAITNALVLYKHFHPHPSKSLLSVKDFRLQLAKELIGTYCSRCVPGRSGGATRTLQLQHFPLPTATSQEEQVWQMCILPTTLSQEDRQFMEMSPVWCVALP